MGIVGYGDIGRACAKYAKGFGMQVLGLRRHPDASAGDPLIDKVIYVSTSVSSHLTSFDCRCMGLMVCTKSWKNPIIWWWLFH
jgi:phosphoglycerate dehydrogenase-like enzyme